MSLEQCLPDDLRGAGTTLTPLTGGRSGARVYLVEAASQRCVLKLASDATSTDDWRRSLAIQQRAAAARLAPRVIHHDESRRAVVSEHVTGRPFATRLHAPQARDAALRLLGQTLRQLHTLPVPADATWRAPHEQLAEQWARLATFAIPGFVRSTIEQVLADRRVPPHERPLVTSHNDLNPSNLVLAGERLVLLDWDLAGPNDPFHDLATVALFLRFDDAAATALLAAYDATPGDAPPAALPDAFVYARRVVAALCAALFLGLARAAGHGGGDVARDRAPTLADVHGLIGSGALAPHSAEGAWAFALALIRAI